MAWSQGLEMKHFSVFSFYSLWTINVASNPDVNPWPLCGVQSLSHCAIIAHACFQTPISKFFPQLIWFDWNISLFSLLRRRRRRLGPFRSKDNVIINSGKSFCASRDKIWVVSGCAPETGNVCVCIWERECVCVRRWGCIGKWERDVERVWVCAGVIG